MILALKILGAVAALALGVWLGLPGRYERRLDEIESTMDRGGGRPRRVKRRFTPLAWLQRQLGSGGGRSRRRRFRLESPDDR